MKLNPQTMSSKHRVQMSGKYPVTAVVCPICEELQRNPQITVAERDFSSRIAKASDCPIHNWYTYVHTYSPKFVEYEILKKEITSDQQVLDPFVGTGTTLVECKLRGINSTGVDALDFLVFASKTKTEWEIDCNELKSVVQELERNVKENLTHKINLYERPELLKEPYISSKPLAKLLLIKKAISNLEDGKIKDILNLAFAAIIVPSSNVRYGPNFGLIKPRDDVDVFRLFKEKIARIISDLEYVQKLKSTGKSRAIMGDSRTLTSIFNEKFDHVITSPPYPQEHDYSRQVRLEIVFFDYVKNIRELRALKQKMLRASTRNVYSTDNESQYVTKFKEIVELMIKIERRVKETKGTSGFEKLYSKLVGEYFGGMYRSLEGIYDVLEPRGTAALLVGDSHCFKMVHIPTAGLLGQLALDIGFKKYELEIWQNIKSTAHKYLIPEYILELYK